MALDYCYDWNYKQWTRVLQERLRAFLDEFQETLNPAYSDLCNLFETCLSSLNKMPRIWIMYLEFLIEARDITRFRRAVNGSLQSLPVTQQDECDVTETRELQSTFRLVSQIGRVRLPKQKMVPTQKLYETIAY